MPIISVTQRKGGCGKSNLVVHLWGALKAKNPETKVLVVDSDPQGSVTEFFEERKNIGLPCPALSHQVRNLKHQEKHFDYIIVDVAGRDSKEAVSVLRESDLTIVPVKPSSFDLNALGYWLGRIEAEKEENTALKTLVVINSAHTNPMSHELKDTKRALLSVESIATVSKTVIHERIAYRTSIANNKTIHEWNDSKAKGEVSCLLKEIIELSGEK